MNESRLDPGAREFFPSQIFYPYPPPPLPVSLPPASPTASRTLLLSMVPTTASESTVRRELEVFGDVRAVQMERRRDGLVTVHFYDVRDAQAALAAIQEQHMQQQFRLGRHYDAVLNNSVPLMPPLPPPQAARGLINGRVVWAQFTVPVTSGLPDGNNQGTLVVFNVDSGVSASSLKQIFESFGPVRELRETPNKRNQRFVEFYDVRNAANAMAAMSGQEIYGRNVMIEYSRRGGAAAGQSKKPWKLNSMYNTSNNAAAISSSSSSTHRRNCASDGSKSWSSGSYEECSSKKTTSNSKNSSRKPWKGGGGGPGKEHDARFLINEDAIVESNCRDPRTTVMIKNIPNKYSQKLLLNMLDNHCIHCNEQITGGEDQPLSSYDFVYLPIDFINKCNVGYGFVNMTSPEATLRLYKAFHHQNWEVFNSRKICQVTYARLQGLEALREHFKNSKFPGDTEEYMPVVFSPPRDGRTLTDPLPIIAPSEN
ncbi:hypothetical protein ACS0TY_011056 [Phlomoides rotata]